MIYIISISVIIMILICIPWVVATDRYRNSRESEINLVIDEKKDPRYFGKRFAEMIERELPRLMDNTIQLTRKENIEGEHEDDSYPEVVEKLVIKQEDFVVPKNIKQFKKEIYTTGNLDLSNCRDIVFRAAYSDGKISLGNSTIVERWVDARLGMICEDGCNLGVCASTEGDMKLGYNCRFKRLYGRRIMTFNSDNSTYKNPKELGLDEEVQPQDFIYRKSVTIGAGEKIYGNISSECEVILGKNSVVTGNVFAKKNIIMQEGAVVLGNIFTYGNIDIHRECVAGQEGVISSVICREDMKIGEKVCIYGYVACSGKGET